MTIENLLRRATLQSTVVLADVVLAELLTETVRYR